MVAFIRLRQVTTTDYLPFLKVGDRFEAELADEHFLKNFKMIDPNKQQVTE